jgi:hypothetical protein
MTDNKRIIVGEMNLRVTDRLEDGAISVEYWHAENVDVTNAVRMKEAGCPSDWVLNALLDTMEEAHNCTVDG